VPEKRSIRVFPYGPGRLHIPGFSGRFRGVVQRGGFPAFFLTIRRRIDEMNTYFTDLRKKQYQKQSMLCAGLDIDLSKIPACFDFEGPARFEAFGIAYIKAVAPHVAVIKINIAFHESEERFAEVKRFVHQAHDLGLLVIIDGKRRDIGNTSKQYAKYIFDVLGADATTTWPYMGYDSVEPFLKYTNKGIYFLCRTSNSGAEDFQNLEVLKPGKSGGATPLYQVVAEKVAREWNVSGNCGLVIGATAPAELKQILEATGYLPSLIPGVCAQGGKESDIVPVLGDSIYTINQSRSLMYPKAVYEAKSPGECIQIMRAGAVVAAEEINKYITITGGY
jgi:orotidine-5'-phosphate decarboxylase